MTTDEIKELNESGGFDTWEQGIFVQPNHIPVSVKEPVVYMRWNDHGTAGGSCWSESSDDLYDYEGDRPEFTILIKVCKYLYPNITPAQIRQVEALLEDEGDYDDGDYYGNSTHYKTEWVKLSDVENFINKIK